MCDWERLIDVRDRLVIGRALAREISDLAAAVPAGISEQIEALASAALRSVEANLLDVSALMNSEKAITAE